MAYTKDLSTWAPLWWFPLVERKRVGLYLSSAPGVPVDTNSFWYEYRWRFRALSQ